MVITKSQIRERILEVFKKIRSNPIAPFNEESLMNYLVDPPKESNQIKNTFRNTRKYHEFMDALELEFSICFSYSDLDKEYDMVKLIDKIQERIGKHKGNVIMIKTRKEEKMPYYFELIITVVLIILFLFFKSNWFMILPTLAYIYILNWIRLKRIQNKKHTELLYNKIMNLK